MKIALEQARKLRRGTNRTAVLPTAQPDTPARPVFDPDYQEWGFWVAGIWIPLPGQPDGWQPDWYGQSY
jgi:hypothetical protein